MRASHHEIVCMNVHTHKRTAAKFFRPGEKDVQTRKYRYVVICGAVSDRSENKLMFEHICMRHILKLPHKH